MPNSADQLYRFCRPRAKTEPIAWIERNVSLRYDPTSASDAMIRVEPYQRRPILAQYRPEVREVTVMGVEQTGKSLIHRLVMLHKMVEYPGPRWIIYESDEKAADINAEQFIPLIKSIPSLAKMVNRNTVQKQRYQFPNGSIVSFSGAGTDITSKPIRDGVADELDTWPLTDAGIRQNLRNFRKRFRTYWARGEGCLVKVSSPSPRKKGSTQDLTRSAIAEEFAASDGGYWTLRCQKCGRLSMKSHAIHCLQWEMTDDEKEDERTVIADTLRLECPVCGSQHAEDVAQKLNTEGAYCTRDGVELTDYSAHVGCQCGALACPRVFSWLMIAKAQLAGGSTADIYAQANFFNSWRGLTFRPKAAEKAGAEVLRKHCAPMVDPATLANVFLSADTQDNGWYWVVRGVDQNNSLWPLACGFVRTIAELKKTWDAEYLGILPVMGIIDEGGHGDMPVYTRQLVDSEVGLYAYKGGAFGEKWRHGNVAKTILASAKAYQADLLYYMYSQDDRSNCYWYMPPEEELDPEYLEHLTALQPNKRAKHGDQYEQWDTVSRGTADHYFDCEKMLLALLDVAYAELAANKWRRPVTGLRRQAAKEQRRAPVLEM